MVRKCGGCDWFVGYTVLRTAVIAGIERAVHGKGVQGARARRAWRRVQAGVRSTRQRALRLAAAYVSSRRLKSARDLSQGQSSSQCTRVSRLGVNNEL